MTANIGHRVGTDPVQLTTTLRPAGPGRSGYLVAATVGGRPPVAGHFEPPSSDPEYPYDGAPSGADDRPVAAAAAAAAVGTRLFEALFSGALRRCWAQAVEVARSRGLRLVINSAETTVQALPWELLFDRVLVHQHLALVDGWRIVRSVPEPPAPGVPRPAREITVQVVTSLASAEQVSTAQLIRDGLPGASVRTRHGQSTAEMEALLREQVSDVLHIATDGVELPDGRQYLTLGDAASTDPLAVVVLISAAELLEMLRGVHPPGLVVFTGSNTEVLAAELAKAVPAVVGMRGGISARGCESFLRGFYHALGRGEPLEAALMAGRAAQREIGGTLDTDWAAAVAYLSGPQRLTTRDNGDPLPDPVRAPEQSATGTAPLEGQTHVMGGLCTADRHGLELRMRKLDLAELLTRWRPVDSSLWPDVVVRGRADLEVTIAEASRGLDGSR